MSPQWTDLRVAVIGVGDFGARHAASYRTLGVRVHATVDPDAAASRIATNYSTVEEMLAHTEVDAASVCTPGHTHRAIAETLIAAGVAVLVEKPMAETAADAAAIATAAKTANVVCQPGHILRFSPPHRALRDAVDAGQLGRVLAVSSRRDRPQTLSRLFPRSHPALLTAVHDIDLAVWYSGAPVVEARAVSHQLPEAASPSLVWAELRHANGVVSSIRNSYLLPENTPNHTSDLFEVYGSSGVARVDFGDPTLLIQADQTISPDWLLSPESGGGALAAQLRHFLARVSGEESTVDVTAGDGVHVVAVAEALIESANSGGDSRRVVPYS